jgi:hypothetical protein
MISIFIVEKLIGIAILLAAIIVGIATINHGDFWLGSLFLLGQAQTVLNGHRGHGHKILEESSHIKLHTNL